MTAVSGIRAASAGFTLPQPFAGWFAAKGWSPRAHQLELLAKLQSGHSTLLIAPTGAGKTLAGFLPTLVDLAARPRPKPGEPARGVHTLYISPLKALAVDIRRNLESPVAEMGLGIAIETRTGDTPAHKRQRQKFAPPDILLTTPEQLALLIAANDAERFFSGLRHVVLDELHSLVTSKRGHLLSLGLARLRRFRPDLLTIGLSATVAEPDELRRWLVGQNAFPPSPLRGGVGGGGNLPEPAATPQSAQLLSPSSRSLSPGPDGAFDLDPGDKPKDDEWRKDDEVRGVATHSTVLQTPPGRFAATLPLQGRENGRPMADLITVAGGAKPQIRILASDERVPWAGHSARYAIADIYAAIKAHRTTLIFVNTRSQAELVFQELWRVNDDTLPIALHHGSLDVGQRRKVEAAMAVNGLRAVVATSTLDLGIDWGDVDLVIHVGAPKGASRLAQRIGRSNHRMDEPSQAILVPANRFEVLECQAALDANYLGAQDTPPLLDGALDVLCQHILGSACAAPFRADDLYAEVISAAPYAHLDRAAFDDAVAFVSNGGYALKTYDRFARIRLTKDGTWRVSNPHVAQQYRLNVGTIIEAPMLTVRLTRHAGKGSNVRGGPSLGKIEESFLETLSPGDTFLFAGKVLRFEGIREADCIAPGSDAKVPYYAGGKFPLSTYLAEQVRAMLADPDRWSALPDQVSDWLRIQRDKSVLPARGELLIETFPRASRFYTVAYPFEGRLAHQTLGMLLTRRMERAGARPLGFVASDYALAIWSLNDVGAMLRRGELPLAVLFDEDMLGDDLEAWLAESWLLKRTFRNCALISGLIEKRHPGLEKSGRQVNVGADLIYDVLRRHEPDHILLRATRNDAATGLLDVRRLSEMLFRIKGHIRHKPLERISPLAVPIMLEIGKEPVPGDANDTLLAETAENLVRDAMGEFD